MDAFQGQKVMQTKLKLTRPSRPLPDRMRQVVSNLNEQGPGTLILVGLFLLLTFFDVLFNVSRAAAVSIRSG